MRYLRLRRQSRHWVVISRSWTGSSEVMLMMMTPLCSSYSNLSCFEQRMLIHGDAVGLSSQRILVLNENREVRDARGTGGSGTIDKLIERRGNYQVKKKK